MSVDFIASENNKGGPKSPPLFCLIAAIQLKNG